MTEILTFEMYNTLTFYCKQDKVMDLAFCIVLERYFRFEISLLSILCMLIARMEMGTSQVSGDSDIIT